MRHTISIRHVLHLCVRSLLQHLSHDMCMPLLHHLSHHMSIPFTCAHGWLYMHIGESREMLRRKQSREMVSRQHNP